jgi:acyl dehydratase
VPLYLDDFRPGRVFELGTYTFTTEDIVDFARRWDPQPFHVDEAAGRASIHGGLIASGWHTVAVIMRLMVDCYLGDAAAVASPGIDEIRWLLPVRPGHTITGRATIVDVVPSRSRADRGHTVTRSEAFNQDGARVLTITARGIFLKRPTPA